MSTMANEIQYHSVELFGGAIVADLPTTYSDVSNIRQVPDHQEVYLDSAGFTSIIFEILELASNKPSVTDALHYHLEDLVDDDIASMKIWSAADAMCPKILPAGSAQCATLFATSPPGEKQRGRKNEPDFVGVLLTLVRLEKVGTDFLVVVNVPHVPGSYGEGEVDCEKGVQGPLLEAAVEVRRRVLETFEIREWGLFGEEE